MPAYQLRLPTFEGPLDLLLQLIERRQMDITTVSLSLVTDQYMEHLRTGEGIDSEQLSEFVAVAAKLLLIKSLALLPRPPRARPEEPTPDPTDLTERLREYEAIKRAAIALKSREEADLRSYPYVGLADSPLASRVGRNGHANGSSGGNALLASQLELFSANGREQGHENGHGNGCGSGESERPRYSAKGLLAAFRRATARRPEEPAVEVSRETWTVAEAVKWLVASALGRGAASFRRLTSGFGRVRLVAAFLAALELHRQGRLLASQAEPYADIELEVLERGASAEPTASSERADPGGVPSPSNPERSRP